MLSAEVAFFFFCKGRPLKNVDSVGSFPCQYSALFIDSKRIHKHKTIGKADCNSNKLPQWKYGNMLIIIIILIFKFHKINKIMSSHTLQPQMSAHNPTTWKMLNQGSLWSAWCSGTSSVAQSLTSVPILRCTLFEHRKSPNVTYVSECHSLERGPCLLSERNIIFHNPLFYH